MGKNTRTILICSGKGGVGKTTLTANLGIALANSGATTAVLDADFGLRNLDLLLGLENRIIYTAQDVLDKNCRLDQALVRHKKEPNLAIDEIVKRVNGLANKTYAEKEKLAGAEALHHFERSAMLQIIDHQWRSHLSSLDQLRQGIGLRAYGQKDPLTEYKKEAFNYFNIMLARIRHRVVYFVLRAKTILI